MTSSDHAPPEDLSALLDGQAPEWAGHVEGCASCGAELTRLRAVRDLVGRPVPSLPPAAVDAAVARALRELPGQAARPDAPGRAHAAVPEPDRSPVPLRRRSRPFVVGVASGSVAAVLLAVLAAFAVVGGGGDGPAVDTALAPGRESAVQDRAASGAGAGLAAPTAPPGPASGGDLGEVGDAQALAGRLRGRIPVAAAAAAMAGSPSSAAAAAGSPQISAELRPCEQQARSADPSLGTLVYAADGTRQGQLVVVLGFRPGPAGTEAVSLLVLARDGCAPVFATAVP